MKQIIIYFMLFVLTVASLIGLMLASDSSAVAQGNPTPASSMTDTTDFYRRPAIVEGDAEWIMGVHTFESHYPDGMNFTAEASSSVGDIESASVLWSYVPGQQRRMAAELDEETGFWNANWEPDVSTPPWVAVNYHWRFADAEGNLYQSEWFTGEEYSDTTRTWERFESDDIIIFLQEGFDAEVATMSIQAMEFQRDLFLEAWGQLLPYKPRAVFFRSQSAFNEWRLPTNMDAPDTGGIVIGQTLSNFGVTIQFPYNEEFEQLAWATVPHEVAHMYQAEFISPPSAGLKAWWTEGQATFFEAQQDYDYEQRVRELVRIQDIEPLFDGSGPDPSGEGEDGLVRYGYDVGYTFIKWFTDEYGLDGHREVVHLIEDGSSLAQALEMVTGMPILEVERAWRSWIGLRGDAATLFPTPTFYNPLLRTPEATAN